MSDDTAGSYVVFRTTGPLGRYHNPFAGSYIQAQLRHGREFRSLFKGNLPTDVFVNEEAIGKPYVVNGRRQPVLDLTPRAFPRTRALKSD